MGCVQAWIPKRRRRPAALIGSLALAAGLLASATPQASAAAHAAPACVPTALGSSATLANGAVSVSPEPGSMDASYLTQISFLGVPASEISDIAVAGSRSGPHAGRLAAYSQGDGASFVPAAPFIPGEVVSVTGVLLQAGGPTPISWQFIVAVLDTASRSLETPPPLAPPASEFQHFPSNTHLQPPTIAVTTNSGMQEPGDLFLAPYAGPGQAGPMILDAGGGLVWFDPLPGGARAADLRVQEYAGKPVLTWWQDPLVAGGRRDAGVVIADSSYRYIAIVRAGNGYQPDLHVFQITPQGTALFTVYDAIRCNLSAYGGPANGAVADTLLQEIDLKTGLVRYEWHSLDHVAPTDSYLPVTPGGTPAVPWDYFHINAVDPLADGDLLVDSRNTWAAYELHGRSGQIAWTLGGKHSSFAMGPGASPAWQHDARLEDAQTISFFDNGDAPKEHPQSRGIVLHLDLQGMTASLLSSFVGRTPLLAPSQGDNEPLAGGGWMVGWGQEPYFSEFAAGGQLLFEAHLPAPYQSFTVFKYPWSGNPTQRPQVAVRPRAHGGIVVYASWNGATAVAAWRVLGGARSHGLAVIATAPRRGFQTAIAIRNVHRYVAVQALGAQGQVLAGSPITRG
jgi:hypothetical protein